MVNKRLRKRIIIIAIYIIIFVISFLTLKYLFSLGATCSDKLQNQGEKGIDCGGPCKPCGQTETAQDLIILEKAIIAGGNDSYDIALRINNQNMNFGLKNFSYELIFKDSAGNEVGNYSGTSFILPAEKKYLVINGVKTNNNATPVSFDVKFGEQKWEEFKDSFERPQLNIYSKRYNQISAGVGNELFAVFRNEGSYDLNRVFISVILRNSQNKIIAVGSTEKNTLRSKEEREFRLIWPYPMENETPNIEIEAYTNMLDPLNLIKI
jgi:hypothetical protein